MFNERAPTEVRREPAEIWRGAPTRVSWGAIFAGTVAALAVWAMLYALGVAFGLTLIDPQEPSSVRASGAFAGVWGIIAPLIALFIGGFVASYSAVLLNRLDGALHGLLVWGLTTLIGAWLMVSLVSALVGGAFAVGRTAVQAGGTAFAGVVSGAENVGALAKDLGLNINDAIQPINDRLRAEGKPPITADQLEAATKDIIQDAIRQGRFDRELLINSISQKTALSRADAEDIARRLEAQLQSTRSSASQALSQAAQRVETGALQAAETTGRAFWGVFGALFLGLAAAIGGALVGLLRRQRIITEQSPLDVDRTTPTPLPPHDVQP